MDGFSLAAHRIVSLRRRLHGFMQRTGLYDRKPGEVILKRS